MPIIYLSPSTQEWNYFVTGGTEEQYMNQLADLMVPYLDASGIRYVRNTPDMTAASSNAAPEGQYGTARGSLIFYYPGSVQGEKAAQIVADGLKAIYPVPNLVQTVPTTSIGEVRRVRAPSVFIELAFHDNLEDANWIIDNLGAIARNIVLSLTEYFQIPFFESENRHPGVVDVTYGYLNIRSRPTTQAPVIAQAPDGAPITIINQWDGWYLVNYQGSIGYAKDDFVPLN